MTIVPETDNSLFFKVKLSYVPVINIALQQSRISVIRELTLINHTGRDCKDDRSKLLALEELESGNVDKLTWANVVIAANGDEVRARAEYLKIRKVIPSK